MASLLTTSGWKELIDGDLEFLDERCPDSIENAHIKSCLNLLRCIGPSEVSRLHDLNLGNPTERNIRSGQAAAPLDV